MDMVIMVIDVTKGIQAQTAEGLLVAEISVNNMVVVLNKIDRVDDGINPIYYSHTEEKLEKVRLGVCSEEN